MAARDILFPIHTFSFSEENENISYSACGIYRFFKKYRICPRQIYHIRRSRIYMPLTLGEVSAHECDDDGEGIFPPYCMDVTLRNGRPQVSPTAVLNFPLYGHQRNCVGDVFREANTLATPMWSSVRTPHAVRYGFTQIFIPRLTFSFFEENENISHSAKPNISYAKRISHFRGSENISHSAKQNISSPSCDLLYHLCGGDHARYRWNK